MAINGESQHGQSEEKRVSRQVEKGPSTERRQEPLDTDQVVHDIEKLPPEKREAVFASFQYSGPLPPAKELQAYDDIAKGTADRIIRMAEEQATHRRAQEKRMIESSCEDSRLGLWLGFIIGMSALVLSGIIALYASATAGSLLALSSITSLVGVFVYGSRQKRNYPEESREIDSHAENDGEKKGGVNG